MEKQQIDPNLTCLNGEENPMKAVECSLSQGLGDTKGLGTVL